MKNAVTLVVILFGTVACASPALKELARFSLPEKTDFENVRLGGLSSLWHNPATGTYFTVSDDRGKFAGPRMYELAVKFNPGDGKRRTSFEVAIKGMYPINEDYLSEGTGHGLEALGLKRKPAPARKDPTRLTKNILDLEAGTPLPWGTLLISSEGDYRTKPRTLPRLLEVKLDGSFVRNFEFPPEYLPEPTGKQTQGIVNNHGVEGLTTLPSKDILASVEGVLYQDDGDTRWLRYSMPTAWQIKPVAEYLYPLTQVKGVGDRGVSDIKALSEDLVLVTEREYSMGESGLRFLIEFYLVDLREKSPSVPAKDTKVPHMKNTITERYRLTKKKVGELSGTFLNIEGVESGPVIDGKPTLLMVVDNNFVKGSDNEFVLMQLEGVDLK